MVNMFKCFILLLFSFCMSSALSSTLTFVKSTRLIFDGSKKSASFPLQNDTHQRYLVKGSVKDAIQGGVGKVNNDFLVLPEVLLLKPGQHQQLQVRRVGGKYPQDRESVFYLNGFFVPESNPNSQDQLNLAISVNVKMFYRPASIYDFWATSKVTSKLEFLTDLQNKRLVVKNPTPYFVTFSQLNVGKESLTNEQLKMMVAPFGKQIYTVKSLKKGINKISWTLIDELGNDTDLLSREIRGQ